VNVRAIDPLRLVAICLGSRGQHWRLRIQTEAPPPHRLDVFSYHVSDYWSAPALRSWAQVDSLSASLPGQTAFSVWGLDESHTPRKLHGYNATEQLAIGSAFKLYVLGSLSEAVVDGRVAWTDTVPLRDEWKAIGSGKLRERKSGERLTVLELATEMMAISDNTAIDHLIHIVGRDAVESWMRQVHSVPDRNHPFLTTREFFGLKFGNDPSLMDGYLAAGVEERAAWLERAADSSPDRFPLEFPVAIDRVEWFASTDDLCRVMFRLQHQAERPGLGPVLETLSTGRSGPRLDPGHWARIAYKGGREVGVLNLSWLRQRHDGRRIAVSITFNDPEKDIHVEKTLAAALAAVRVAASADLHQ
jgi:hypothetical protein